MFGRYNFLTHRSMPINVSCIKVFYVYHNWIQDNIPWQENDGIHLSINLSLCTILFDTMEKK